MTAPVSRRQALTGVAATGIGLLWRTFRALPEAERGAWHAKHLAHGYLDPDYLNEEWRSA